MYNTYVYNITPIASVKIVILKAVKNMSNNLDIIKLH